MIRWRRRHDGELDATQFGEVLHLPGFGKEPADDLAPLRRWIDQAAHGKEPFLLQFGHRGPVEYLGNRAAANERNGDRLAHRRHPTYRRRPGKTEPRF